MSHRGCNVYSSNDVKAFPGNVKLFAQRAAYIQACLFRSPDAGLVPCKLPFNANPPLRAYLYDAYITGLLAIPSACAQTLWQYYQHPFIPHAKVSVNGAQLHASFMPPMNFWESEQRGLIRTSDWIEPSHYRSDLNAFGCRISASLSDNRYVYLYVNEFYIPGSGAFLRRNNRHELLVIGIDSESSEFICVGNLASGEFGEIRVPLRLLHIAVFSKAELNLNRYCSTVLMRDVQVLGGAMHEPTRDAAKALLARYARGERVANKDGWHGFHTHAGLTEYLQHTVRRGSLFDLRLTRLLYEHKQMLQDAVAFIITHSAISRDAVANLADDVVKTFYKLHWSALEYNTEKDPRVAERMRNMAVHARVCEDRMLRIVLGIAP